MRHARWWGGVERPAPSAERSGFEVGTPVCWASCGPCDSTVTLTAAESQRKRLGRKELTLSHSMSSSYMLSGQGQDYDEGDMGNVPASPEPGGSTRAAEARAGRETGGGRCGREQ